MISSMKRKSKVAGALCVMALALTYAYIAEVESFRGWDGWLTFTAFCLASAYIGRTIFDSKGKY